MYKIRDYPYLAIRGRTLFPGAVCAIELLNKAEHDAASTASSSRDKVIAIFSTVVKGEVGLDDLDPVGVLAVVRGISSERLELEVTTRVRLRDISKVPKPIALVEFLEDPSLRFQGRADDQDELLRAKMGEVLERDGERGRQARQVLEQIPEGEFWVLVCFISSILVIPHDEAQKILASLSVEDAQDSLLLAIEALLAHPSKAALYPVSWSKPSELASDVDNGVDEELANRLRGSIEELDLDPATHQSIRLELDRLEHFEPTIFEHQDTFARLEEFAAYPWYRRSGKEPKLDNLKRIFARDIFAHERAKDLLLDFLSARKSGAQARLPLVILVGAKGLGQGTMLAALATSIGCPRESIILPSRNAARFIAGAARSLPDSSPGAVYRAAVSAGVMDPLLHISSDTAIGEETAQALDQLTDPLKSYRFRDFYLDLPIDTSEMTVVLEVRSLDMVPKWLRDRSFVVGFSGYSPAEKRELWTSHLWPEALRKSGGVTGSVKIESAALEWLIKERTNEVGVAELSSLAFSLAMRASRLSKGKKRRLIVDLDLAKSCLGAPCRPTRKGAAHGVVSQVVRTAQGVAVLESAALQLPSTREGKISSSIPPQTEALALGFGLALSERVKSCYWYLATSELPENLELDGVAFSLSLALRSASLSLPVARDLAVFGKLGFGGEVLAVEEERERVLAAWSAGYQTIIVPAAGYESLVGSLPQEILSEIELAPVSTFEEAAREMSRVSANRGNSA